MIELDLFGIWGRRIVEKCRDEVYCIQLEEVEKIPEEYLGKEFAGRISFSDNLSSWVKDVFSEFGYGGRDSVNDDYRVISGYFPTGFIPRFEQLDYRDGEGNFPDIDNEFGDEPRDEESDITDETERCEHNEE